MVEITDSLIITNKLQLHYWFSDKTHSMDALVHNKCERELLEITKTIASMCGVSVKMETEPSGKGGLKSWLTITAKSPKKTPSAKITLVTTLIAASMVTPNSASIGHIIEELMDKSMADKELNAVQKEQLRSDIAYLKSEISTKLSVLDQSSVLKKRRSNFYDLLRKYPKVKSISVVMTDDSKKPITEEQVVARDDFKTFIISSDQLAPLILENAIIEIISPVLIPGRHKWKGVYNGLPISFSMKSDEFMAMVQSGKVEFKSGSTINCTLEIEKKITGVGIEKITGYTIIHVVSYFENGKTVDTTEVKQNKQKQNTSKTQLDLFG